MTKDVLVKVSGAHVLDGETEDVEVITAGSYYFKNGRHYILYEEMLDGETEPVRNTIRAAKDQAVVIKSGAARARMEFRPGRPDVSCYVTPYGQMMIGVITDCVQVQEEQDVLRIRIDYTLEINYERATRCRISIEVSSRSSARLDLQADL